MLFAPMSVTRKTAWVVYPHRNETLPLELEIQDGRIYSIREAKPENCQTYVLPGFVDAHVHIESSLLMPSQFARLAVLHGTVGTISDPHEIANVCGMEGMEFMLENAARVPFHFFFGAPSCVPATAFETAGAVLDSHDVAALLRRDDIWYLAEMMNYPGVLHHDPEVMAKLQAAKNVGKPIDGHAPGLRGEDAARYIAAGPSTDHECFELDEALGKIAHGMNIQIREGSAARNFDALHPLLKLHPEMVMFCSDDMHPDTLLKGHINVLVKRALALGYDLYAVLRAASTHVVKHYRLPVGQLELHDSADFIEVDNLHDFNILETWISGTCVARNGVSLLPSVFSPAVNQYRTTEPQARDLELHPNGLANLRFIEARDGQLITGVGREAITQPEQIWEAQADADLLKIAVYNRYAAAKPAVAVIRGLGLRKGAIASTVAHDSHNLVVAGSSDAEMLACVNALNASKGGLAACFGSEVRTVPLAVAGLMSDRDAWEVAQAYIDLDAWVKTHSGTGLRAPFMTLSFMALLVIPSLKLSDKGLFDGDTFQFTRPFY